MDFIFLSKFQWNVRLSNYVLQFAIFISIFAHLFKSGMKLEVHDHWIFFTNFWFDDIFTQAINMKCAAFKQYNLWFSDRNDLSTLSGKKTCQTSMCIFCCYHLTILNILRVRFCLTSNRRTFFFPGTENLNFGDWKLLRNWGYLKVWKLRGL